MPAHQGIEALRSQADGIPGFPLHDGGLQVEPPGKLAGPLHPGQGGCAGYGPTLFQQVVHATPGEAPVHGGKGVGHDFPGVAPGPDGGLILQGRVGMVGPAGHRPGLGQPEPDAIPHPFQVIEGGDVIQGDGRIVEEGGQAFRRGPVQHRRAGPDCRHRLGRRPACGYRQTLHCLAAQVLGQQAPLVAVVFTKDVFVALRLAAYQGFAQTPIGVDHHAVAATATGITAEGDARGPGRQQGHDDHGHGLLIGQAQLLPVGPGSIAVEGRPHLRHRCQHRRQPLHVEAGDKDAGVGSVAGILSDGGGAHREGLLQPAPAGQLPFQVLA